MVEACCVTVDGVAELVAGWEVLEALELDSLEGVVAVVSVRVVALVALEAVVACDSVAVGVVGVGEEASS